MEKSLKLTQPELPFVRVETYLRQSSPKRTGLKELHLDYIQTNHLFLTKDKTLLKITFFAVSLLVGSHQVFHNKVQHTDTTYYAARSSYTEGYEKFIFAVPDNNISASEARSHRLDTEKHHPTLRELKKGRSKQTKENGTSHWNDYAV